VENLCTRCQFEPAQWRDGNRWRSVT
jgi:hypothetical protein